MRFNRRTVLKGALATGVATSTLKVPAAVAQAGPIKVGFLTVKSGALASGGLQMEQGMLTFFKERNNQLAGRPVELRTPNGVVRADAAVIATGHPVLNRGLYFAKVRPSRSYLTTHRVDGSLAP